MKKARENPLIYILTEENSCHLAPIPFGLEHAHCLALDQKEYLPIGINSIWFGACALPYPGLKGISAIWHQSPLVWNMRIAIIPLGLLDTRPIEGTGWNSNHLKSFKMTAPKHIDSIILEIHVR